jgi:hypothetical protein
MVMSIGMEEPTGEKEFMTTTIRSNEMFTVPTPSLALEFMLEARLKPPVQIGAGAFGTRIFYEVAKGRAEGPRFKAEVLTGGGDWLLKFRRYRATRRSRSISHQ